MVIILGIISGTASLGVPILFYVMKLITQVKDHHIDVYFYPFKREQIPFEHIVTSEARTYNALTEYGGWGIRMGRGGRAYNISGNRGVQLTLADGRKILIGSQRADELAEVIDQKRNTHA